MNKRRFKWLLIPLVFIITGCGLFETNEMEENTTNAPAPEQTEETSETMPATVYVPDDQAMGMDTIDAELTIESDESEAQAMQALLSGQVNEDINILPAGTEINHLQLNEEDDVAEIDVSEEFTANMNAGSTGELFIVYTLVNTISDYYGTEEVILTVAGEPYQGAHMALQEGETFQFNQEMVNE